MRLLTSPLKSGNLDFDLALKNKVDTVAELALLDYFFTPGKVFDLDVAGNVLNNVDIEILQDLDAR